MSGQEVSKSRGSGRVASIDSKISRVGSGRVGSRGFQNLAGRVGSSFIHSSIEFIHSFNSFLHFGSNKVRSFVIKKISFWPKRATRLYITSTLYRPHARGIPHRSQNSTSNIDTSLVHREKLQSIGGGRQKNREQPKSEKTCQYFKDAGYIPIRASPSQKRPVVFVWRRIAILSRGVLSC